MYILSYFLYIDNIAVIWRFADKVKFTKWVKKIYNLYKTDINLFLFTYIDKNL
jgi:hypothetical protein